MSNQTATTAPAATAPAAPEHAPEACTDIEDAKKAAAAFDPAGETCSDIGDSLEAAAEAAAEAGPVATPAVTAKALPLEQAADITANPYRADFPLLAQHPDIHYLDSAATSQRPKQVLDAQLWFEENLNANPLRGVYDLSAHATEVIGETRRKVASFLGASNPDGVVFTRNTTESLNLLALRYAPLVLEKGDTVVISILEHHSNLIPWQLACKRAGAELVYLYPDKEGFFSKDEIEAKITERTKIVSVTMVSNVLGVRTPLERIGERAHKVGAAFFVDGAQGAPHLDVDVTALGCDAFAFSGHKMFAPMGVGVLWARDEILQRMEPLYTGGEMIEHVTQQEASWAQPPYKFEAGTQAAEEIFALGAAIDYMHDVGMANMHTREHELVRYCMAKLAELPYVHVLGSQDAAGHVGVVAFEMDGVHSHDVASILDSVGVDVRAGDHCAQPLLAWLGVESSCRASFSIYNDQNDVDLLIEGLKKAHRTFHGEK